MCVPYMDSGKSYTTCECPQDCPEESEPVCSFYHREFNNRCEMHKYACAHDLTMKVMNQGNCPTDNLHVCSDQFLLQFPTRYLEWIMIAREHSIDPTTSLDFNARADGLTEDERNEILSWEFEYIDRDKNNVLDTAEIQDVFNDVLGYEPCLYGFLKSCDLNEKEGIEKREWDFCFPKTGTAFETRK
ncbi:testican-1-like isoform X2 [Stylophora pistillata]|nr:testican-1-like isoform X2 [Stylophora pistillata]